jgi:hypothetical protein
VPGTPGLPYKYDTVAEGAADVDGSLAEAVAEASRAGRWDVVAQLARELEARRVASVGNVVELRPRRTLASQLRRGRPDMCQVRGPLRALAVITRTRAGAAHPRASRLPKITLYSHNSFGETDDNWNVQSVQITASGSATNRSGNPFARLTGSVPSVTIQPNSGC